MIGLFQSIGAGGGLVASVIGIYQFFSARDKSEKVKELENRNKELTETLASMFQGATPTHKENLESITYDLPRLSFKHSAYNFDRLLNRSFWGFFILTIVTFFVLMALTDGRYEKYWLYHFLGITIVGLISYFIIKQIIVTQMKRQFLESKYLGDAGITEVQTWIGVQPWKTGSKTSSSLNKLVRKWHSQ